MKASIMKFVISIALVLGTASTFAAEVAEKSCCGMEKKCCCCSEEKMCK